MCVSGEGGGLWGLKLKMNKWMGGIDWVGKMHAWIGSRKHDLHAGVSTAELSVEHERTFCFLVCFVESKINLFCFC